MCTFPDPNPRNLPMRRHPFMLLCMLPALILFPFSYARDPGTEQVPVPEITVTFKVYTWFDENRRADEQPKMEELYFRRDTEYTAMKLSPAEVSPVYTASMDGNQLVFYRKVHRDEMVLFEKAASVSLSTGFNTVFLYLFNRSEAVRIFPVNTSMSKFPPGHLAFLNSSSADVVVGLNGKATQVAAGSMAMLAYELTEQETIRIVVRKGEPPYRNLAVMTVGGRKDQRLVGLFYPANDGRNFRLLIERGVDSQATKIIVP